MAVVYLPVMMTVHKSIVATYVRSRWTRGASAAVSIATGRVPEA